MRRRLTPLLLLALVACGREAAGIGERASAVLAPQVQQVRASASAGDRAGAQRKLAELRQTVADLRERGELSEAGASKVLAAAAEVEARLAPVATPTQAPPPAQVSTTTPGQRDNRGTTRTTAKDDKKDDKEPEDEDDD